MLGLNDPAPTPPEFITRLDVCPCAETFVKGLLPLSGRPHYVVIEFKPGSTYVRPPPSSHYS